MADNLSQGGGMSSLKWGRHYLMCPPDHFAVTYEINPWMSISVPADADLAREQWTRLVTVLRGLGATVDLLIPQPDMPDLVFTANAAVVEGKRALLANFAHKERLPELPVNQKWLTSAGFEVLKLPRKHRQEGAGDALPFAGGLVAGHGIRSDLEACKTMARLLDVAVYPVELVDERMYHVDLAFCPLDENRAMVAPDAFSPSSRDLLFELISEPLVLDLDEALEFCANSVVIGDTVVMPSAPVRVAKQLEQWGFNVVELDMSEFQKAGGAARCLTLPLDVTLPSSELQEAV